MLAELILLQQVLDDKNAVDRSNTATSNARDFDETIRKYKQVYEDYIARGRKGYGL